MRILITGNKGFVGTETQKLLEQRGHEVVGYDIMEGKDIRDGVQLESELKKGFDRILHLAAIARIAEADKNPRLAFETNVLGTRNVAVLANALHIPVVYASTGSVYMPIEQMPPIKETFIARGNSAYGCTKYMGETYIREFTPHIILRYAHLYGKEKRNRGLVGIFINRIERGLEPSLYGGKQSNDFTYIKDVAEANSRALESSWENWNQIYNVGTGEELTAESAGKTICEIMDYKGGIKIESSRHVDAERFVFDISKAEQMLGFKAHFKFRDGLKDMLEP